MITRETPTGNYSPHFTMKLDYQLYYVHAIHAIIGNHFQESKDSNNTDVIVGTSVGSVVFLMIILIVILVG